MGIDLMFGYKGYNFCELNVNPGFEEFDKTFEISTAEIILNYVRMKGIN